MFSSRPTVWLMLLLTIVIVAATAACGSGSGAPGGGIQRRLATRTPQAAPTATAVALTPTPASPRSVVRAYKDAQGRSIVLYHGRAVGRRGDWGWAHIVGKHLNGEWLDGGPLTTFEAIGITTPAQVQEIIGRSLQDPSPFAVANGRREYRLAVENGRFEMLTVVGSDGAIITAYPDSPRRQR